jgi:hypothetical protein
MLSIPELTFLPMLFVIFDTLFAAFITEFPIVDVEFDIKSDTLFMAEFPSVVVPCKKLFVPFAKEFIIHSIVSDRLLKE